MRIPRWLIETAKRLYSELEKIPSGKIPRVDIITFSQVGKEE